MILRDFAVLCLAPWSLACAKTPPQPDVARISDRSGSTPIDALSPVDPGTLVVTSGKVTKTGTGSFSIRDPGMRAQLGAKTSDAAEIEFTYLGPSQGTAPLASGELRRQIGIKLRARDTCNVVYAMWHIEPSHNIEISVKSTLDQSTHEQCGDRGYVFLKPTQAHDVPPIHPGQRHTLRAVIRADSLEVTADGMLTWVGPLPASAFAFDGPIGIRSDNGDFDVELRAPTVSPR